MGAPYRNQLTIKRPQWSLRTMLLAIAIVGIALVVFVVPAFKQPSNCGGNSEALNDVKLYLMTMRWSAEARPDHEFSIDAATPRELGQLHEILPGPAGAGFLVSRHAHHEPPTGPKRLMIVCDRAFTNVPRRLIGRAPPTHAAAYSDGTCELISVAEFNALDRSELVLLNEMLNMANDMQTFTAYEVSLPDELDLLNGEGGVCFRWPDAAYGFEELSISLDGHCSRRMPIHSGNGAPKFVSVERDRVVLRFASALSKKLKLVENVEVIVSLSDGDCDRLRAVAACLNEPGFERPATGG